MRSSYRQLICATPHSPSNKHTLWTKILFEKRTTSASVMNDHIFWGGGGWVGGGECIFTAPYKNARFGPFLSQTNPLHVLPFCYFKIHLNIILPFTPKSWQWPLSFRLTHHNPASTCLPIHATCPAHFILNFIILRTTGDEYKSWRYS